VTNVLVKVLAVDEDRVTPTASLQRELGADSLDLLEITFRLEHEFDIEIPRHELFPESMFRSGLDWVQDGKLTDEGLAELRSRLPYADLSSFRSNRRLGTVSDLFTVDLVTAYLGWKLGRGTGSEKDGSHNIEMTPGSCSWCGNAHPD
jgi:acyl carrier protein